MANCEAPPTVPPTPETTDGQAHDGQAADDDAKVSFEAASTSGEEARAAQPMAATFAAEQPPAADDDRLLKVWNVGPGCASKDLARWGTNWHMLSFDETRSSL